MNIKGFSLVELIVVIAIISTLATIGVLSFNKMQVKYNVEKQTKELRADIDNMRLKGIHTKAPQRMMLDPKSVVFRQYSSEGEAASAGTVVLSKNLSYQIQNSDGSSVSGLSVAMDFRGYTNDTLTLKVVSTASNAAVDCIIISTARTSIGKMSSGVCNAN